MQLWGLLITHPPHKDRSTLVPMSILCSQDDAPMDRTRHQQFKTAITRNHGLKLGRSAHPHRRTHIPNRTSPTPNPNRPSALERQLNLAHIDRGRIRILANEGFGPHNQLQQGLSFPTGISERQAQLHPSRLRSDS